MLEDGIANNNENFQRVRAGQSGYDEYKGFAQFAGTAATMNLPVPFRRIKFHSVNNPVGIPATDETIYVDAVADVNSDGHEIQLVAGADGGYVLPIARTAGSPTADLIFAFKIEGLG